MKKCKTCGCPMWLSWLLIAWPWSKRVKSYKDAYDCIHVLPYDWDKRHLTKQSSDQKQMDRESIMKQWDSWRKYIAGGGKASWPRDAFESLLDYFEEQIHQLRKQSSGH